MNNIAFRAKPLEVTTYCRGLEVPNEGTPISSFIYGKEPLRIEAHDEIPFFFAYGNEILGGMKIAYEDSLNKVLLKEMGALIEEKGLDPDRIICYLGPSLTFAHCPIDRATQIKLIEEGYRMACKRTSEVDYIDLPVLNMLMLRKLGIKMKNIYIADHGTADDPKMLYSHYLGDEKNNVSIACLLS